MNTRSAISITEVHNGTPLKLWDVNPQMANKLVSIPMHFLAHLVVFGNRSRGLFWGLTCISCSVLAACTERTAEDQHVQGPTRQACLYPQLLQGYW